jgi:hypothetical protein
MVAAAVPVKQAEAAPKVAWPTEGAPIEAFGSVLECGEFGVRFAAFAAGCLGAATPAKAGDKLGLMGSVSEEELVYTLRHLETLARQRAAKLAGVAVGQNASVPGGAACSAPFERALRDALSASGDRQEEAAKEGGNLASQLFELLPHDQSGRADLLHVFGMASDAADQGPGQQTRGADIVAKGSDDGFSFCPEYVEIATDLPSAGRTERVSAERHLVELEDAAEASWESAAAAINAIRASMAHASEESIDSSDERVAEESVIRTIARCCGSRRPALAKGALRALLELAEASPRASWISVEAWSGAAEAALGGCLGALKVTKAAAKIAEAAAGAILQRVATEASPAVAAAALLGCLTTTLAVRPPAAASVAAGLRVLILLVPRLAGESGYLERAGAVCEEVLKARTLSAAYSEARAVQRELKKL